MAHAVTKDSDARILEQCAQGRRTRYVASQPAILAADRLAIDANSHFLATVIDGETSANVPIFTAPCAAEVVRCYVNALTYPTTSGAATVRFYKANIGATDDDLCAAIDIDAATAETAIDGVMVTVASELALLEGQLVYAVVALSATTSAISDALVLCVEWVPKDTP